MDILTRNDIVNFYIPKFKSGKLQNFRYTLIYNSNEHMIFYDEKELYDFLYKNGIYVYGIIIDKMVWGYGWEEIDKKMIKE